jgi:hypothetical protein
MGGMPVSATGREYNGKVVRIDSGVDPYLNLKGPGYALLGRLQHFHFWCLQSDHTERGFSSKKAVLRCPALFRVEVKML